MIDNTVGQFVNYPTALVFTKVKSWLFSIVAVNIKNISHPSLILFYRPLNLLLIDDELLLRHLGQKFY